MEFYTKVNMVLENLTAIELTDTILQNLDKGKIPISIILDLSKAIDTLNNAILLKKLEHYGIKQTPLNWLINYLSSAMSYLTQHLSLQVSRRARY